MGLAYLLMEAEREPSSLRMGIFETSHQSAIALDKQDPLAHFRQMFRIPASAGKQKAYFLGNSLGLQPVQTGAALSEVLDQWADWGVEAFFHANPSWMGMHDRLREQVALLAGGLPSEVAVMNQLTVNIHLMMVSFYRPAGKRKKILVEDKAFPSDQYALSSYLQHLGMDPAEVIIAVEPDSTGTAIREEKLLKAIEQHADELALVFVGGVHYYTGQLFDMQAITLKAHEHGALVGFDLAHAMGNVRLNLHEWGVDFACWCSYKYLNGGPGAVAGVFIHERFHGDVPVHRLSGWWGNREDTRFRMADHFVAAGDANGWQISTPSILQYACLQASLQVFEKAGWENILKKQALMIGWLNHLLADLPEGYFHCLTPPSRGCQVSLFFPEKGRQVYDLLFEKGFMVDWREPNVIRLAPVPLYNTYVEIWSFYEAMKEIIKAVYLK